MLQPDPTLLKSLILLIPATATGLALLLDPPGYFQRVGLMLAVLLNIPYLFLVNILAAHQGWWAFHETPNAWLNTPVELVLGWSIFWGVFLPYIFRKTSILITILAAAVLDLWLMPQLPGLFQLGDNWLHGEALCLAGLLLPSIAIFRWTSNRQRVLARALIQSLIWGGWIVFMIPEVILQMDGKSLFDLFDMSGLRTGLFLAAMAISMLIGYLALIEFALVGNGTPIPFDPPRKLVISGIYAIVANPLQISTLLMLSSIMLAYQSYLMLLPIASLIIYAELFVRWHHTIDIAHRFPSSWPAYRRQVRNWIPRMPVSCSSASVRSDRL